MLAAAALLGGVSAGIYGLNRILRRNTDPALRQRAVLLAMSVLPIPLWFLAFPNQVAIHAWFIDRIVVWLVAAGFSVFSLAIAAGHRARPPSEDSRH